MNEELSAIASQFEAEWNAGREPSIEAAVVGVPEAERTSLIALLVARDCRFRKARKFLVNFDDYAARFPCLVRSNGDWHPEFLAALEATSSSRQTQVEPDQDATFDSAEAGDPGKPALVFQGDGDEGPGDSAEDFDLKIPGYEITGRLGEGGMGVVWRATQLATKREVALKCAASRSLDSPRARATFEREVELAAMLEHPNIARVYDSGIHDGVYYYALELLDGLELDDFVEEGGLSEMEVVGLMVKVCGAVEVAHQRGVIHRDLKPGNIMVTADGEPHVLDFGLAKSLEGTDTTVTMTQEGSVSGTLAFMAPEQAAGRVKDMDTRTDVYALGAILYRLIVGKSHHDMTGGQVAILRRISEEEVIRPRSQKPELDSEMEAILLKALSREGNERYRSAGDLGEELQNYLDGSPISAAPATLSYFLKKRLRKHKAAVGLAMAAMLAVMIGIGFYIFSINAEKARTEAQKDIADKKADEAAESARVANEKVEAARRTVYFNDVGLALAEYHNGNLSRAAEILKQCPEDLRRWEWDFLNRVCSLEPSSYQGAGSVVYRLTYSPNGELLAGFGREGHLRVWRRGERKPFVKQDGVRIGGMKFTPDGRYLISRPGDFKKVEIRRTTDFEVVGTFPVDGTFGFDISPDSKRMVYCSRQKQLIVHEIPSFKLVKTLEGLSGFLAFLPDGEVLVDHQGYQRVNLHTGKIEPVAMPDEYRNGGWFRLAPSGEIIYQKYGQSIRAWDIKNGKHLFDRQVNGENSGFWVSPDGRYLSYPNWKSAFVYDALTGEQDRVFRFQVGHNFYVSAISPDSKEIVVGFKGTVIRWPFEKPELGEGKTAGVLPVFFGDKFQNMRASMSRSGRWAVAGSTVVNHLGVVDLATGVDHLKIGKNRYSLGAGFSPDERFLLHPGHGRRLELTELATGRKVWEQELMQQHELDREFKIADVAITGDNQYALVVFSWRLEGKRHTRLQCRDLKTRKLVWAQDLNYLPRRMIVLSKDAGSFCFSTQYGFRKIETATGKTLREYAYRTGGGGDSVLDMALSPDETKMLMVCSANGTVVVADLEKWETKFQLLDHDTAGTASGWSPDNERFFTGSLDHRIFVWDTETGRRIMDLDNRAHVGGLLFTPAGELISFGGDRIDERMKVWRRGLKPNDREALAAVGDAVLPADTPVNLHTLEPRTLNHAKLTKSATEILIHKGGKPSPGVSFPVRLAGSYRFKGAIAGGKRITFSLPVGYTHARWYVVDGGSWLSQVNGVGHGPKNPTLRTDVKATSLPRNFEIAVTVAGDQAQVVASLDSREFVNWQGRIDALDVEQTHDSLQGVIEIVPYAGQEFQLSKLEVTPLDGLAYRLGSVAIPVKAPEPAPGTPPASEKEGD